MSALASAAQYQYPIVILDWSRDGEVRAGFAGDQSHRGSVPFSLPLTTPTTTPLTDATVPSSSAPSKYILFRQAFTEALSKIFFTVLGVKSSRSLKVLVIEPHLLWSKDARDALYTVLFQDHQVATTTFQPSLYLSLLGAGLSTGTIVYIGERESHILCCAFHRPLLHSMKVITGGTQCMIEELHAITNTSIDTTANPIQAFSLLRNSLTPGPSPCPTPPSHLTPSPSLTENQIEDVVNTLLSGISSNLDKAWDDCGIVDGIIQSISLCAMDLKTVLLQKIVFVGIGSDLPGVQDAIMQGIKERLSSTSTIASTIQPVNARLPYPGTTTAFVGASVFTQSQADVAQRFVTREAALQANGQATGKASALARANAEVKQFSDMVKIRFACPDMFSLHESSWKFGTLSPNQHQ